MPRDPEKFLADIFDSCQFLLELTAPHTFEHYAEDRSFRSAIERELQIIGEAVMVLDKVAPEIATKITESHRIIRFRHVLVHGYSTLKHDLVWGFVKEKLPILHAEVKALLKKHPL